MKRILQIVLLVFTAMSAMLALTMMPTSGEQLSFGGSLENLDEAVATHDDDRDFRAAVVDAKNLLAHKISRVRSSDAPAEAWALVHGFFQSRS